MHSDRHAKKIHIEIDISFSNEFFLGHIQFITAAIMAYLSTASENVDDITSLKQCLTTLTILTIPP